MCLYRFVNNSPIFRCIFVSYLCILHIWSFIIIIYHTSMIDFEPNIFHSVTNNNEIYANNGSGLIN